MSLRQAIKSRLKVLDKDRENSPPPEGAASSPPPRKADKPRATVESDEVTGLLDESGDAENKTVYELQLTQLQEQLVTAMIENQNLTSELKEIKEKNGLHKIINELEEEKQKSARLTKHLEAQELIAHTRQLESSDTDGFLDIGYDAVEEADNVTVLKPARVTWVTVVRDWLLSCMYELVADFTEDVAPESTATKPDKELTVKKLKENIKRFKSGVDPIYDTVQGTRLLVTWSNPSLTLITFMVYMYTVWHGWLLPLLLFLVILRLSLNFLVHKGIRLQATFLPTPVRDNSSNGDSFRDLGVSDKFNLVLQVARKVQNSLGNMADALEKLKNLLLWKQPDVTTKLFVFLSALFVASCVLSGRSLALLCGLFLGFKLFIVEFVHTRFPRFKQRHDTVDQMWRSLPTDLDLEERSQLAAINRHMVRTHSDPHVPHAPHTLTDDDHIFCQTFNLPASERPCPGWGGGRRCTLIDRDKSWASGLRNGRLYLTPSFLCFERRVLRQTESNIRIPLPDITYIHKAKPYSWMPGAGMSIEICVIGYEKPHLFGALLNRDDIYEDIIRNGRRASLSWAQQGLEGSSGPVHDATEESRKVAVRLSDLHDDESAECDAREMLRDASVTC